MLIFLVTFALAEQNVEIDGDQVDNSLDTFFDTVNTDNELACHIRGLHRKKTVVVIKSKINLLGHHKKKSFLFL